MYLQRFAGERTEPATPKRRQDARSRGQVARSPEVAAAALLLAAAAALEFGGGAAFERLAGYMRRGLTEWPGTDLTLPALRELLAGAGSAALAAAAPIVLVGVVVGVAVEVAQVGFLFSLHPLQIDFSRVNPLLGFQRLFSRRALREMFKSLLKAALVGGLIYQALRRQAAVVTDLAGMDVGAAATLLGGAAVGFLWRVGLALAVLAAADYFFQRKEFEDSLKMSKEEVKQELRESEGDPRVRARIRERQRAIARRRMMQDVPRADVVVTNPTHYAVALRYDAAAMSAPVVLAKGQGWLAQRIKEIAARAGVQIVENPPLAQALYRTVDVGDAIPAELYQAVAEVLAFVYRSRRRAAGGDR